jgi:hypothetical protein
MKGTWGIEAMFDYTKTATDYTVGVYSSTKCTQNKYATKKPMLLTGDLMSLKEALRACHALLQYRYLFLISIRRFVNSRVLVWLEGLGKLKEITDLIGT